MTAIGAVAAIIIPVALAALIIGAQASKNTTSIVNEAQESLRHPQKAHGTH